MTDEPTVAPPTNPVSETAAGLGIARVVLKPRKAKPFLGRHPWVFNSAISHVQGDCRDGDIVNLVGENGRFIARGVINRKSQLSVRLYTWEPSERLTEDFWRERIRAAIEMRKQIGYDDPGGAARLVFGEADGLSGLVVDRYGEHVVVQINSLSMCVRAETIFSILQDLLSPRSVNVRSEAAMVKAESMTPPHGLMRGDATQGPVFFSEHGLRYGIDLLAGQKTGFYLDQRENRRVVAGYTRGRRVLDLFCFAGSFGIAASKLGGARDVVGIDSSSKAIALARANAALNEVSNIEFHEHDCFDALDQLLEEREKFGAIILDPPKFTRNRRNMNAALNAYHRINRGAVQLLERGGILVTCSCSGNITREDFLKMLSGVSQKTGRQIQVLEQRGPSADHPFTVTCPEGEYLKCFLCRVD